MTLVALPSSHSQNRNHMGAGQMKKVRRRIDLNSVSPWGAPGGHPNLSP